MAEYFAQVIAPCINCGQIFGFNPHKVPSTKINGVREPVCQSCLVVWNAQRVAAGLEAIPALPGAYEPIPESEL